ncbi:MAG: hypothetical protein ACLFXM_05920 [Acidimicrobiia bacterium]
MAVEGGLGRPASGEADAPVRSRASVELYATLVMAVAAVLTAWSAFQSAKWSGLQAIAFNEASAARIESSLDFTEAGQQTTIDVITFLQLLEELRTGVFDDPQARTELEASGYAPDPDTAAGFLFERLRGEFRPVVRAWLAEHPVANAEAPPTPFSMDKYRLAAVERGEEQHARAEQRAADARDDNQRSDNYVMTTVAFATVLFFAGVSTKLVRPISQRIALGLALVTLVGAVVVIATFPVEV